MNDKTLIKAYYISLFFIGLPSFFLFNPILNVLNLGKLIWIILFIILVTDRVKRRSIQSNRTLLILFAFFFLCQSVSIIRSQNVASFLGEFKEFFFSGLFLIISLRFIKSTRDVYIAFLTLLFSFLVNAIIQVLMLVNPAFFLEAFGQMIHQDYLNVISANLARGRLFLTTYNEALIPLVIYFLIIKDKNKNHKKKELKIILGTLIFLFIFILSLVSGFRTQILMSTFAFVGALILFWNQYKKIIFILFLVAPLTYLLYLVLPYVKIDTGLKRVLETGDNIKEISTGRSALWENAREIGLSSPFVGIGLGNYYDSLSNFSKQNFLPNRDENTAHKTALQNPHNVFYSLFAESGILGLLSFVFLVIYFLKRDLLLLRSKNALPRSVILCFWTLFIFALLNPWTAAYYQTLFWLFRAILENIKA